MDGNLEQMFKKVFPFWEDLSERQRVEIQMSTVRNLCPKKTGLHFGGGECAGVQSTCLYYFPGRRRYYTIPAAGGGCEYPERSMYAKRYGH